eukprot:2615064-Lingulodinium_polyedra.AAC.1
MITWGTLLRAIFNAIEKEPNNKMVQHIISTGLNHCIMLNERTPRDVVAWMRDFYNAWHRGSSTNFLEALQSIAEIDAAFAVCSSAQRSELDRVVQNDDQTELCSMMIRQSCAETQYAGSIP